MRRRPMQVAIEELLEAHGMLEAFRSSENEFHLRLEQPGYMNLVIEKTPDGHVSVAHYFRQHGDAMRDPEIVFHCGDWYAIEITQDPTGVYQRLEPGHYSPSIEELARIWARNIRAQGWAEAKALSQTHPELVNERTAAADPEA